jgi:hypothetical protein
LKESVHLQCFNNVANGYSESRNLADCFMVSTRSSAKEMTATLVGTWLVAFPLPQFCAHGARSPDIYHKNSFHGSMATIQACCVTGGLLPVSEIDSLCERMSV